MQQQVPRHPLICSNGCLALVLGQTFGAMWTLKNDKAYNRTINNFQALLKSAKSSCSKIISTYLNAKKIQNCYPWSSLGRARIPAYLLSIFDQPVLMVPIQCSILWPLTANLKMRIVNHEHILTCSHILSYLIRAPVFRDIPYCIPEI